ncbi:MAG: zonular occludens toxin [Inoviridae sp.]|nr:MAG: zonular occludens toxin [Inoviridae sp.]
MRYFNGNVILVTGAIRTGKTLYVVAGLKAMIADEQKKPEDKRRQFFTDIDGLNLEGVGISPTDWRDAPAGSVVIYDECQLNSHFQADGKAVSSYDFVLELTLAGRKGYTIIFISQSPRFIHSTIRNLANEHIHVQRLHGAQKALICRYPKPVLNPDSASNIKLCADQFNWEYPKTVYGDYSSLDSDTQSAEHQVKFKLPAPLIKGFAFSFILFIGLMYYGGSSFFASPTESISDKKDSFTASLSPVQSSETLSNFGVIVGSYLDKNNNCIAYDSKANTDDNYPDCFRYLPKPAPSVYTLEKYNQVVADRDTKINSFVS